MGAITTDTLDHCLGEDFNFPFELEDANGDPYVITGTVFFWIAQNKADADALVTKSSPASGVTIDYAAGGLGQVDVARADVSALTAGDYYWALWEENASSKRIPLAEGEYRLIQIVEDFQTV